MSAFLKQNQKKKEQPMLPEYLVLFRCLQQAGLCPAPYFCNMVFIAWPRCWVENDNVFLSPHVIRHYRRVFM